MSYGAPMPLLFGAVNTTTTEVQRVVGDPLPLWLWLLSGALLLAAILVGGTWARRRQR